MYTYYVYNTYIYINILYNNIRYILYYIKFTFLLSFNKYKDKLDRYNIKRNNNIHYVDSIISPF